MGLLQVTKLVVQVGSSTIDLEPETASLSRQCPKDNIRLEWTTRRWEVPMPKQLCACCSLFHTTSQITVSDQKNSGVKNDASFGRVN